jgi:protein gp37
LQGDVAHLKVWPLPNVWLGVSCEDQERADERIPDLLATPAAVRFVSAEPLLGPIDFTDIANDGDTYLDALRGHSAEECADPITDDCWRAGIPKLDWIIVGGESGTKARPMHPDWARSIRDQCEGAGVPFFFKQHGQWVPLHAYQGGEGPRMVIDASGRNVTGTIAAQDHTCAMVYRVGKKRAGRLLDGREHNDMPELRV